MICLAFRTYCFLLISLFLLGTGEKVYGKHCAGLKTKGLNSFSELTITIDDTDVGPFFALVGENHVQTYYVKGNGFQSQQIIYLDVSDASNSFTIFSELSTEFSSSAIIQADINGGIDQMVMVKFEPSDENPHTATIDHTSNNATPSSLIVDGNPTPMPLELLTFNVKNEANAITMIWTSPPNKSPSYFVVEVMKNHETGFEKIGQVFNKNNIGTHTFKYNVDKEGMYYFRLKQVDKFNTAVYSRVISIKTTSEKGLNIKLVPNPVEISSQLHFNSTEKGKVNISLSNLKGKEVGAEQVELHQGVNNVNLHFINNILPGIYILKAEFKGKTTHLKLIKN